MKRIFLLTPVAIGSLPTKPDRHPSRKVDIPAFNINPCFQLRLTTSASNLRVHTGLLVGKPVGMYTRGSGYSFPRVGHGSEYQLLPPHTHTSTRQAILSQFSQSKGKAKIQPSVADAENEEELNLEPDLEDSDDEEDNISEPEDSADEIEPAVEDNDNARIDEVIEEIDADPNRRVPALTAQEIKLGRYSVAKVRML